MAHGCADFRSYHDEVFLANQLAGKASLGDLHREKLASALNGLDEYHQRFSFSAKVLLESEAFELNLFGYKSRCFYRARSETEVKKTLWAFSEVGGRRSIPEATRS